MNSLMDIAEILRRLDSPGSFATHFTAACSDLNLRVQGVGAIRLPLTAATARKLSAASTPAYHGYKEQTRLDPKVRDTGEIAGERVEIDDASWRGPFAKHLDRIRRSLGLPVGSHLQAQLHNLLVYAPGQHFAQHRDSEKADGMIGTLVVCLPSTHAGGEISIRHQEETLRVAGSRSELTLIAFYADCPHEILPVQSGYRVALTYDLILTGTSADLQTPRRVSDELVISLRRFFTMLPPPRWKGDDERTPPERLVYLLDHQYTRQGLRWNLLKNADAKRAALLRQAARELDCETFLALADVHETWACEEPYPADGHRWYEDEDEDEDEDDDEDGENDGDSSAAADYELTDLIETDVELRHWVSADGTAEKIATGVADAELCMTKPSVDFDPFETEHEGYTGNAGNTVEHWYHRAAIVLWPRSRNFVIRAKASPRWAIAQVAKAFKNGQPQAGHDLARSLLPFWKAVGWRTEGASLLAATLKVAAVIEDPSLAASLLQPFGLTRLTAAMAPWIAQLLSVHGLQWWQQLLRTWASSRQDDDDAQLSSWTVVVMPELSRAVCAGHPTEGPALIETLLARQCAWFERQVKHASRIQRTSERQRQLTQLGEPWLGVLRSAHFAGQAGLHRQLIHLLTTGDELWPLPMAAVRAAHSMKAAPMLRELELRSLHGHCVATLTRWLEEPPRAADDWSIMTPVHGTGPLHRQLTQFLRAHGEVTMEWPLAKDDRRYIHGLIDDAGLPVTHVTRRTGRPFTLVLQKTAALFDGDRQRRRGWLKDLEWLRGTAAK